MINKKIEVNTKIIEKHNYTKLKNQQLNYRIIR